MPTPKQMEKLAAEAAPKAGPLRCGSGCAPPGRILGIGPQRPSRRCDRGPAAAATSFEIQRHVLRISCRRCERTVEIQTADAVRLYGGNAVWKDVAQRLLDNTCQQRTGRHEEDGCWPGFDMT